MGNNSKSMKSNKNILDRIPNISKREKGNDKKNFKGLCVFDYDGTVDRLDPRQDPMTVVNICRKHGYAIAGATGSMKHNIKKFEKMLGTSLDSVNGEKMYAEGAHGGPGEKDSKGYVIDKWATELKVNDVILFDDGVNANKHSINRDFSFNRYGDSMFALNKGYCVYQNSPAGIDKSSGEFAFKNKRIASKGLIEHKGSDVLINPDEHFPRMWCR